MTDSTRAAASVSLPVEELVLQALPLVQYAVSDIAGRLPRHVHRDDLVSAGMLGLAQAAKAWDPTRGVAFDRYARTRIQGALLDELRSRDWATRSVRAGARRMQAAADDLQARTGAMPSPTEVGRAIGLTASEVNRLMHDIQRATVLNYDVLLSDAGPGSDPSTRRDETVETLLMREQVAYLRDAVVSLPERMRKVVVEYFFEERQMQDIADDLGVTESRISQIRAEALVLLRAGMDAALEQPAEEVQPPVGRAARRTATYLAEVAAASDYRTRLSADAPTVAARVAATA